MIAQTKSLYEINRDAMSVLNSKIGISDTIRFLNQFTTGLGDYTKERKKTFDKMTLNDITMEIKESKK